MAQFKAHFVVPVLLMMLLALEAKMPPGITKNPSTASCMIKKYKHCYNLVQECPEFCPDSCTVECASCKPICSAGSTSLLEDNDHSPSGGDDNNSPPGDDDRGHDHSSPGGDDHNSPPGDDDHGHDHSPPGGDDHNSPPGDDDHGHDHSPPGDDDHGHDHSPPGGDDHNSPPGDDDHGHDHSPPVSPSPRTVTPPTPPTTPKPTPSTPSTTPPTPTPSPSTPSPEPPTPTPPTPTPTPPTPSSPTPSTPSPPTTPTPPAPNTPSTPSPTPPTTPNTPSTPSPIPPTTPSTPYPPPSPSPPASETAPATARCRNNNYPQCYNIKHVCPKGCPGGCEVDCVTCKPVCNCDRPGAVCQDPRFIGGDGITFYFHGKKDTDFCLVSDSNLHINAHFIGRRNDKMKRDFTWVQSIAIFFDRHQLFIGALKTSTWDDSVDRLALSFDDQPVTLPETDGSKWQSSNVSIARVGETNSVEVEVDGKFKITAKVVPITEQDSRVHNYGITKEDCFAHLDLGFRFYSLSDEVNGVLGQTYRAGYVSRVNMGAKMPVMGGDRDFQTSSLFSTDCAVAQFNGGVDGDGSPSVLDLPSMRCASGIDGKGVVCKR